MGDEMLEKLRFEAARVRAAIEATDLSYCGLSLENFPEQCCHHAVKLLAFHLAKMGWDDLQTVTGILKSDPSRPHLWLLAGPILLDITADQYEGEGQSPVLVTRNSPWHAKWQTTLEPLERDDVLNWPSMNVPGLDAYRKVMASLTGGSKT